jgi:hypothetical protein
MKKLNVILSLFLLAGLITSCNKDSANPAYPYSVRMTDAPAVYDEVNIDLKSVVVTGSNGETVTLNVNAGIYNLLDFANGHDTLIASGTLTDARVEQIRLILGTNNTVVVDGDTYPLSTPSADQTGLKIQVHQDLQAGVMQSILLDFDANQSIIKEGSGIYKLKPVIRTIQASANGSIQGNILPEGTLAVVTAVSSSTSLSYSSAVNSEGEFKIMGLPSGMYSLTVTPVFPLSPITQTNISVTSGITTNIGTVIF